MNSIIEKNKEEILENRQRISVFQKKIANAQKRSITLDKKIAALKYSAVIPSENAGNAPSPEQDTAESSRDIQRKYNELTSKQEKIEKKILMYQDKIKALEVKEKLLEEKGRNQYVYSLGLITEKYVRQPEYISEADLDFIIMTALSDPKIIQMMDSFAAAGREEI